MFVLSNYCMSLPCRTFQDGLWSKRNWCWHWNTCCHASTRCWIKLGKAYKKQLHRCVWLSLCKPLIFWLLMVLAQENLISQMTTLYFNTWFVIVSYLMSFALLHVQFLLSSVHAVILPTASIGGCCGSVSVAYGCWYHFMCFLLVCLDCQRSSYWAREAIKGYHLVPFHADCTLSLSLSVIKGEILLEWRKITKNDEDKISFLAKKTRKNAEKANSLSNKASISYTTYDVGSLKEEFILS